MQRIIRAHKHRRSVQQALAQHLGVFDFERRTQRQLGDVPSGNVGLQFLIEAIRLTGGQGTLTFATQECRPCLMSGDKGGDGWSTGRSQCRKRGSVRLREKKL